MSLSWHTLEHWIIAILIAHTLLSLSRLLNRAERINERWQPGRAWVKRQHRDEPVPMWPGGTANNS